jgi:arylsulfatase A-like enzyme
MLWSWIMAQPGPVFAWWHSYDPHGPLDVYNEPPITRHVKRGGDDYHRIPEYQRIGRISDPTFFAGRYATAVEYADAQVGRVYDVLHNTGRWDDALIIITADHGESFDERELWFDHGTTAYEEQLHVPLIIRYPRGEGGGRSVDALVMLEDVVPTVLDYLGMKVPGGLDGVSLLTDDIPSDRRITGESSHCKGEKVLTCAPEGAGGKMYAVRTDDRTTVRRASKTGTSYERYDREADRDELNPLAAPAHAQPAEDTDVPPPPVAWDATDAARVDTLDAMAALRASFKLGDGPPKKKSEETEAERQEREALEQLGYLDQ